MLDNYSLPGNYFVGGWGYVVGGLRVRGERWEKSYLQPSVLSTGGWHEEPGLWRYRKLYHKGAREKSMEEYVSWSSESLSIKTSLLVKRGEEEGFWERGSNSEVERAITAQWGNHHSFMPLTHRLPSWMSGTDNHGFGWDSHGILICSV